jgi:hypothetical protein
MQNAEGFSRPLSVTGPTETPTRNRTFAVKMQAQVRSRPIRHDGKHMENMRDSGPSDLSVTTPILRVLGILALTCGVIGSILSVVHASWVAAFFCLAVFGGSGAALLLMSGRISANQREIAVVRPLSASRAEWTSITGVEYGGGNLVFRLAAKKRVVMAGPEFWRGDARTALLRLMDEKLAKQDVQVKPTFRAILQAGDRL